MPRVFLFTLLGGLLLAALTVAFWPSAEEPGPDRGAGEPTSVAKEGPERPLAAADPIREPAIQREGAEEDFRLVVAPPVEPAEGETLLTILDDATDEPWAGVEVTLEDDLLLIQVADTQAEQTFRLSIPPDQLEAAIERIRAIEGT